MWLVAQYECILAITKSMKKGHKKCKRKIYKPDRRKGIIRCRGFNPVCEILVPSPPKKSVEIGRRIGDNNKEARACAKKLNISKD